MFFGQVWQLNGQKKNGQKLTNFRTHCCEASHVQAKIIEICPMTSKDEFERILKTMEGYTFLPPLREASTQMIADLEDKKGARWTCLLYKTGTVGFRGPAKLSHETTLVQNAFTAAHLALTDIKQKENTEIWTFKDITTIEF